MKPVWANNTPYSKFLITVGIILLSAVLFTFISTMFATVLFDVNMLELQKTLENPFEPKALSILKLIQTFSALGTFIVPPLFLAALFSARPKAYLGLDKKTSAVSVLLIMFAFLVANPLINFLGEVNSTMHLPEALRGVETWMKTTEEKAAELTKAFLDMKGPGDLFFNLFMIALLPAIGEELVFRGLIQKLFTDLTKNVHVAIWLSAFLFSAMHMQFYGFLPRMLLGGMLGYLFAWSGNLWLPIAAHFVNNAAAIIFTYLFQHRLSSIDPDAMGTGSDYLSVVFSVVLTAGLLWIVRKREMIRTPVG